MAIEQRVELLIRDARAKSGHQTWDYQSGIPQREFVEYLNDAQDHLYNAILQERSTLYRKKGTNISVTAGTAEYTLPTDGYLRHNISYVRYSPTTSDRDLYPLDLRTSREQVSITGAPDSYMLRDGTLILSPIPSQGGFLQLEYQYEIPTLDIRRATVSSVDTTLITLSNDLLAETAADLTDGFVDYVSFVTKAGVILNSTPVGVLAYTASTRQLSTDTDCTAYAGSYVVFGKNASTHSSLPQIAKRYLVEYATMRAQTRDSNSEAMYTAPLLQMLEREILDAFANLEEDTPAIPILDTTWMGDPNEGESA